MNNAELGRLLSSSDDERVSRAAVFAIYKIYKPVLESPQNAMSLQERVSCAAFFVASHVSPYWNLFVEPSFTCMYVRASLTRQEARPDQGEKKGACIGRRLPARWNEGREARQWLSQGARICSVRRNYRRNRRIWACPFVTTGPLSSSYASASSPFSVNRGTTHSLSFSLSNNRVSRLARTSTQLRDGEF